MSVSNNINQYLNNSLLRGKLCRWEKAVVSVFVTDIIDPTVDKNFMYFQIEKALQAWNSVLKQENINLQFLKISTAQNADIVVHWVKVGRVYEGMCKYLSVTASTLNKISIDIGLPNQFGKTTTDLSIFCAIMHEFGHALGLGHGIDIDDIMFVPHRKNISNPSENDLYVLKQIYSN